MGVPEGHTTFFLIIAVNDTITKAILVEKSEGSYVVTGVGEAATTINSPSLDVTVGVKDAIKKVEKASDKKLMHRDRLVKHKGDFFLCSSSSGGGLHMSVAGVIMRMSAESAQRAALGAGAFLMDIFSSDDGIARYERVERMRSQRPDIFLLAGGTDGGNVYNVIEMTELIKMGNVKPRFGEDFKLPVIYAGNIEIRNKVAEILHDFDLKLVENVRPVLEKENLGSAKQAIYDGFMEHVIVHSPGYNKLMKWVDLPIIPTQAAIGEILYAYAQENRVNLIGIDLGGTTLDVYSVFNGIFNRTMDAHFGMSYGICNIMKEAEVKNVMRWIPIEIEETEVRNIIGNIMVHLSTPKSPRELMVQHAAAKEALRLGLEHHKILASRLKGVSIVRNVSNIFRQAVEETHIDMMKNNLIIGRGQVLSDSPKMEQAALILLDGLQPEGVTEVIIDKTTILPHIGMLLKLNRKAAFETLTRDCLLRLTTCIAPKGVAKEGDEVMRVKIIDGNEIEERITFGDLKTVPLKKGSFAKVEIQPMRSFDVGNGRGKSLQTQVIGGLIDIIIDARGRPLFPNRTKSKEWTKVMDAYPSIVES